MIEPSDINTVQCTWLRRTNPQLNILGTADTTVQPAFATTQQALNSLTQGGGLIESLGFVVCNVDKGEVHRKRLFMRESLFVERRI